MKKATRVTIVLLTVGIARVVGLPNYDPDPLKILQISPDSQVVEVEETTIDWTLSFVDPSPRPSS